MQLSDLPQELLFAILYCLDPLKSDLLELRATNRAFNDLVLTLYTQLSAAKEPHLFSHLHFGLDPGRVSDILNSFCCDYS